jgi:RimJ/RimL family protein N-acetyltransferase
VSIELRRARPADAGFLLELIMDEETRPFLGGRAGETLEDVLAEIERSEREPLEHGWFVVELDGEHAGCVGFHRTNERNRIAEAGRFVIHPRYRGRRIGDEVARLFQRHLLVELDFHRIELQIYGFNERAIAHAERSGFVREGVKRQAYFRHGEWQDAVVFSLLREDLDQEREIAPSSSSGLKPNGPSPD